LKFKIYDLYSGGSLFEVVLALGVMTLITVGIVILTTHTVRNSSFSRNKNLASKYALEAIEWIRSERDKNINSFVNNAANPLYCLDSLTWTNVGACSSNEFISESIFLRNLRLETALISGKSEISATVIVSWTDAQGYHESRSTTTFSDIRER